MKWDMNDKTTRHHLMRGFRAYADVRDKNQSNPFVTIARPCYDRGRRKSPLKNSKKKAMEEKECDRKLGTRRFKAVKEVRGRHARPPTLSVPSHQFPHLLIVRHPTSHRLPAYIQSHMAGTLDASESQTKAVGQ
jgi:hypothetical protein